MDVSASSTLCGERENPNRCPRKVGDSMPRHISVGLDSKREMEWRRWDI